MYEKRKRDHEFFRDPKKIQEFSSMIECFYFVDGRVSTKSPNWIVDYDSSTNVIMVLYGQVVAGPPGSGKTTYCTGMQEYLR